MAISAADLRRVVLLTELDDRDLARLANQVTERVVRAGTPLISEGKGGVGFFMLLEGEAEVRVGDQVVATLGAGDVTGELALLDGDARTATVVASTDVRCAAMTAWQFRPFVREHPTVAWRLLQTLAARLREANRASAQGAAPG